MQIYKTNENSGISFSRNLGKTLSSGDILLYLDGDDLLHETCLEKCLDRYSDPSIGFVYSDHFSVSSDATFETKDDSILKITKKPLIFEIEKYIQGHKNWVGHLKSVRKENFIPFKDMPYAEDADWVLNLGLSNLKFNHIPEGLYYWRRGIDSISSRMKDNANYWHNKVFQDARMKLGAQ